MTPERLKELRDWLRASADNGLTPEGVVELLDHVEAQEKALQAADKVWSVATQAAGHSVHGVVCGKFFPGLPCDCNGPTLRSELFVTAREYDEARAEVKR